MREAYVVALYIRLSVEDIKTDSMSIANQKVALHQYVDSNDEFANAEVVEFVDNGHSGTNFERPAVQNLLNMVRTGEVQCIIVKDFTRFGRNSIEVGYFLERVFPLYGIRFISINDDYDSDRYKGETGGLGVAFKYLVAELYSRDLSVKIKTAVDSKRKRGEYQSSCCPYGYRKGANGRLEPDEETAPIVEKIFSWYQEGLNSTDITRKLLEARIPPPAEYRALKGNRRYDISHSRGIWHTSSVLNILSDERYTGDYISGKTSVVEVGSQRQHKNPKEKWIRIPNHHPAIISHEQFDAVQALKPVRAKSKRQSPEFILRGKVFCGCCRHAMCRRNTANPMFYCYYTRIDEQSACHGLRIMESELEAALYNTLNQQARVILNLERIEDVGTLDIKLASLDDCGKRIERIKEQKRHL